MSDKNFMYYLLDTCDRDIEYSEFIAEIINVDKNIYDKLNDERNKLLIKAKIKLKAKDRENQIDSILDIVSEPLVFEDTEEYKKILNLCIAIRG